MAAGERPGEASTALDRARQHVDRGEWAQAIAALRDVARPDQTFRTWTAGGRLVHRLREEGVEIGPRVRLAIIGTSTLDPIAGVLPLAGAGAGLDLDVVHVGGIAQYETAALDPSSALYRSDPDVIVLAPDVHATTLQSLPEDPEAVLDAESQRWMSVHGIIRQHTDAVLLQFNFVPAVGRALGGIDGTHPGGHRSLVRELNRRLAAGLGPGAHLVDVAAIADEVGLRTWNDDRYWFHAKQAVSHAALGELGCEIAATIQAALGRSRKCIVVDLDNTLWGGVVGDDGVENLVLSGSAVGEAHLALQDRLLDLRRRGILLAVCSKNDEDAARAPFERRDDMRLRLSDFVAFRANWKPKPENLRDIAAELSIGLDALVFVDDNPAEREFVRAELPEVEVLDLPDDPAGFARVLATYRGVNTVALSDEDLVRTDHYRARTAATSARDGATDLDEFLHGLEMSCEVRPIDALSVERAAQLVGKTNQWNLTTRRHSPSAVAEMADDPSSIALTARLVDRFVDHGIVGVLLADVDEGVVDIDTFLMSCRVIGRTMERTMLDELIAHARRHGAGRIVGHYLPTDRNRAVAKVYDELGFTLDDESSDGATRWVLDLDRCRPEPNPFISRREPSVT